MITLSLYFEAKLEEKVLNIPIFASGAGDHPYLEPILDPLLIHFTKLMKDFENQEFEEGF